jgi:hypothetical protein
MTFWRLSLTVITSELTIQMIGTYSCGTAGKLKKKPIYSAIASSSGKLGSVQTKFYTLIL